MAIFLLSLCSLHLFRATTTAKLNTGKEILATLQTLTALTTRQSGTYRTSRLSSSSSLPDSVLLHCIHPRTRTLQHFRGSLVLDLYFLNYYPQHAHPPHPLPLGSRPPIENSARPPMMARSASSTFTPRRSSASSKDTALMSAAPHGILPKVRPRVDKTLPQTPACPRFVF